MRFIYEGTWSGYRSGQERVCYRRVVRSKKVADAWAKITGILFTDGTTLDLTLRPAKPREKVKEVGQGYGGYGETLAKFRALGKTGFCRIADLHPEWKERAKESVPA